MGDRHDILSELKRLMEPTQELPKKAPLPEPWGVTYVEPAPGGERRRCGNCVLWASGDNLCSIHEKMESVKEDNICGYHLYGAPAKKVIEFPGLAFVKAKFSGLGDSVPNGTACDNCKFFTEVGDEEGTCNAVYKKKKPFHVHPRGCCSRWMEREDQEPRLDKPN